MRSRHLEAPGRSMKCALAAVIPFGVWDGLVGAYRAMLWMGAYRAMFRIWPPITHCWSDVTPLLSGCWRTQKKQGHSPVLLNKLLFSTCPENCLCGKPVFRSFVFVGKFILPIWTCLEGWGMGFSPSESIIPKKFTTCNLVGARGLGWYTQKWVFLTKCYEINTKGAENAADYPLLACGKLNPACGKLTRPMRLEA